MLENAASDWAQCAGCGNDLILTDMQMPEMDGYTLHSTLRDPRQLHNTIIA